MNVILSSGDYWTRGNIKNGSVLEADDVQFVYYSELASLKFDGVNHFSAGKTSYTIKADYDESKLEVSSNGRAAVVEKSYDASSKTLTITIKGDDYSVNNSNVHVYTVKFEKDAEVIEPEVPTLAAPIVKAEATSDSTIVLTWNPVMTATSFNVYSDTVVIATVTETTYTVTGLEAEKEYCFTVTAINENGESAKSEAACATTKPDAIAENVAAFNIYPNPVSDKLYIETQAQTQTIEIYDMFGRQQSMVNGQQSTIIDVTNLNSGVYFVKVVTENGETVKRFIKK
jgi:hypothetical protein